MTSFSELPFEISKTTGKLRFDNDAIHSALGLNSFILTDQSDMGGYYTYGGRSSVKWRLVSVEIKDGLTGKSVFSQESVEAPDFWSDQAVKIVASKYFRGHDSDGSREYAVWQVINRVADTIAKSAVDQWYTDDYYPFRNLLRYLLVNQCFAFNSPVWFNVGVHDKPQCSACFINSVDDDMKSIMELATTEAMLFKGGSGSGANMSRLRSEGEKLKVGGSASGPVSFMRGLDRFAGVIKSGGTTRRAALLRRLDVSHPDIEKFIECKMLEEKKAWTLIDGGVNGGFNVPGGAYDTVDFQNANHSIGVTNKFMDAVVTGEDWTTYEVTTGNPSTTYKAVDLLRKSAESAWVCGDPGIQYADTINRWHTCKNAGEIRASNPCCFTGDTLVETSEGRLRIDQIERMSSEGSDLPHALCYDRENRLPTASPMKRAWVAGYTKDLVRVTTSKGIVVTCTPEHKWLMKDGSYRAASELRQGDRLEKLGFFRNPQRSNRRYINHRETESCPNGTRSVSRWLWESIVGPIPDGFHAHHINGDPTDDRISNLSLEVSTEHFRYHSKGSNNGRYIEIDPRLAVEVYDFLKSTGVRRFTVARWNKYVRTNSMRGILPEANPRRGISGMSWEVFTQWVESHLTTANDTVSSVEILSLDAEVPVYDIEVERHHNFSVSSEGTEHAVVVSNSEYVFLDDTACNLASINLGNMKSVPMLVATAAISILAQDVIVDMSSYPTEQIEANSHIYRTLGLGYANLGSFLMRAGIPYDSPPARNLGALFAAILTSTGYSVSSVLGKVKGVHPDFKTEETNLREVISLHEQALRNIYYSPGSTYNGIGVEDMWDTSRSLFEKAQYDADTVRNAQVTVLAPTGTISFMMDCQTTGIEPELCLVKYKTLVGGGTLKMVNTEVETALRKLIDSYKGTFDFDNPLERFMGYVDTHGSFEGAEAIGFPENWLSVFDCSFPPAGGKRSIHYMAHVNMMAAVQPFISGAISKTVNMPEDSTVEDIMEVYIQGWVRGLKAIAVYRDNSKRTQPLSSSLQGSKSSDSTKVESFTPAPESRRRRLPDTRQGITHKFSVGGHEGYLHIGLYEDGTPGELFITMSKEGSVMSGLMDVFATSISLLLQTGTPLEDLATKFCNTRFEPSGWTESKQIPVATSIVDYIFKYLTLIFGSQGEQGAQEETPSRKEGGRSVGYSGGVCTSCGGMLRPAGKCTVCENCGTTTGCG